MQNNKKTITVYIATEFSTTPGSRYKKDGPHSGELFREEYLEPHFEDHSYDYKIRIIFDGVEGYATSFLEEAFGGLARKYGKTRCLERLEFISEEDKLLVDEIISYMKRVDAE